MLEREAKRNLELIWLTSGLTPSYHTIADFRKDNPKALKEVFKEFVLLCKNINLIGDGLKAVDGAFLRANASKNQLIMKKNLDKDLSKTEQEIEQYLQLLEYSDKEKQPSNIIQKLPKDLRRLKHQQEELSKNIKLLEEMGKTQYNRTDPDATLMIKPAHNLMAYNSQIVVDSTFKSVLINKNSIKELHLKERIIKLISFIQVPVRCVKPVLLKINVFLLKHLINRYSDGNMNILHNNIMKR